MRSDHMSPDCRIEASLSTGRYGVLLRRQSRLVPVAASLIASIRSAFVHPFWGQNWGTTAAS